MNDLVDLLERSCRPKIVVVGDVILDRYLWGDVDRISPEAPIPLLRVSRQEDRLGGAGSVASMLGALEADVGLVCVLGDDQAGRRAGELIAAAGINAGTLVSADRPTTIKERILGRAQHRHAQQIIRVDHEQTGPLEAELSAALLERVRGQLQGADLLVVSDYGKGICQGGLAARLVALGADADVPVVVDPVRGGDYARYAGCAAITPNRSEAALATGLEIDSPEQGLSAADKLRCLGIDAVLVTLDRDGIAWSHRDGRRGVEPARPRQVYDITGAGDMVVSVLGFALAAGLDFAEAVRLANLAGGLEVERLGVVPLKRRELVCELQATSRSKLYKIVTLERLDARLDEARRSGRQVVLTNGCFDLLHPGHLATLEAARCEGDLLVVGLNSDRSIRALKGAERPIVDEQGRAEMLAALECVDHVVLFDEPSVEALVARVRPDVLVKAAQYCEDEVIGGDVVKRRGGRVALVPMKTTYSTSALVERILRTQTPSMPPTPD